MTRLARRDGSARSSLRCAALIVALCPAVACAGSESARKAHDARDVAISPAPDTQPAARPAFGDADIQRVIEQRLERTSALPAALIDVSVANGIVTLTGKVNRGEERLRAGELAERTRGVRAVVNRLTVEPGWAPRSDLAREIRASLLELSADEFANVTVTEEDTRVRLEGSVPRPRSKEMAELAAWYVAGVTQVDNQIRVRPSVARSDQEIAEDVLRSLRADPYVGGESLDVSVEEGKVRLSGSVPGMFERRRARERALLAGVIDVDDEAVRVLPESVSPGAHARITMSDRETELAILDALRADPRVPEQNVFIEVGDGIVVLSGWVRRLSQKLAAAEDARSAAGTWAVVNRLDVRPEGATPQRGLEQQVIARLREHPSVSVDRIRVRTDGRAVILEGEVSTTFERTAAERAVAAMNGITTLENGLEVRPNRDLQRTDAEIKTDIEHGLWWDPRVRDVTVDVSVENGVATLRGKVPGPQVYSAILEIAFEAAPLKVVDDLWQRQPARFLYSR